MKKRRGYLAILLLAGMLSACGTRGSEEAAFTPTGYPSGEVQQSTVYYNGTRYWYNAEGFDQPLEDGFEKVGEVDRVDNQEYPSEEFGGTRLDRGQEIYANREDGSKIFVKYDSGYAVFERQESEEESRTADENAGEEELLPPITVDTAQLSPSAAAFPMERTEGDIAAFADVNHDGKEERIVFGLKEYADSGMEAGVLRVLAGSGENADVLWEEDYGTVHPGWKNFYLYREDNQDYLVRYIPYMNTGLGTFQLQVFSLDAQGEPVTFRNYEADFSISSPDSSKTGFYGDADKMTEFLEQTEAYLSKSLLLVSTAEGNLAYSTPKEPVTFQRDLMYLFGDWDVTGEGNALDTFRLAVRKNWLETEAIRNLCVRQSSQNAYRLDISVSIKEDRREYAGIDEVMERLFDDLEGDNWRYLPETEMPQEAPDVLISISSTPGADLYISCFAEKELAVIWSAPYVAGLDNHAESVCECYRLSGNAVEKLMEWETTADGSEDSEIKEELVISDIFIPEDECLKHTPFMSGSVECVLQNNPNLERVKSDEGGNGCYNYWKGDGIEYVTYNEETDICGIIISDKYSLDCGLKIGMEESELQKRFPVLEKYEKESLLKERGQIIFSSNIMRDKLGPLQTTDYDCAYACVCTASEEEVEEYQISVTIGYSVTAFVKDGRVCKIVLDLPMAG